MSETRSITLLQPARIVFGAGVAEEALEQICCGEIRRVLLVTSPSGRVATEQFGSRFKARGALVEVFDETLPEPTIAACEKLVARAREISPDLVLAVGGGSVLDSAKLAAALHRQDRPIETFFGNDLVPVRRTRLICLPTTAGAGSEVSPNALVYDEKSRTKKAVISAELVPDAAIIDPTLAITLPAGLTATTGIDALSHCLESYANRAAHPMVDLRSLEGVRLIATNLPAAVADGKNLSARTAVALGSLYGGLALGPVNTAAIHALAYPLSGEFQIAHGVSIALLLPHVVRFNAPASPARFAALARALGADPHTPEQLAAAKCADLLEGLLRACHFKSGLGLHGVSLESLPRLADEAMKVTRLLKNNLREMTRDAALSIYSAAF